MNLQTVKENFHNLIDNTDNAELLEHFYILMSDLTDLAKTQSIIESCEEYNYSEDLNFDEN